MLVALKCDLREAQADEDDSGDATQRRKETHMLDYQQGLDVARRIQALRYLGTWKSPTLAKLCGLIRHLECSAKRNRGVNEAFTEAARVALSVKGPGASSRDGKCTVM